MVPECKVEGMLSAPSSTMLTWEDWWEVGLNALIHVSDVCFISVTGVKLFLIWIVCESIPIIDDMIQWEGPVALGRANSIAGQF